MGHTKIAIFQGITLKYIHTPFKLALRDTMETYRITICYCI